LDSSRWEEIVMKGKSVHRESDLSHGAVARRSFPRVAVARRLDSNPPTRVWSLLLPPRFSPGSDRK
jgi:hypothetical protein